jgi:hypothetical protein
MDIVANLPGSTVVIDSVSGVGYGNALETSVAMLDIGNTSYGAIEIMEYDTLGIANIYQREDDSISVTAGDTITVQSAGGGVVVDDFSNIDGDADIFLKSIYGCIVVNDEIRNDSDNPSADITLEPSCNAMINAPITTAAGSITIDAAADVIMSAIGDVTSGGSGSVTVTADTDGIGGGGITMSDGAVIDGGTGAVVLDATGKITLGQVTTGNATPGAVVITTGAGVVDGGDTHVDIVANTPGAVTTINAATGAGSGDPIETMVAALSITNSQTGGVDISESDSLDIVGIAQSAPSGQVSIGSGGDMTLLGGPGISSNAGGVTLDAAGGGALAVNGPIATTTGGVNLAADGAVTFGPGIDLALTSGCDLSVVENRATGGSVLAYDTTGGITVAENTTDSSIVVTQTTSGTTATIDRRGALRDRLRTTSFFQISSPVTMWP